MRPNTSECGKWRPVQFKAWDCLRLLNERGFGVLERTRGASESLAAGLFTCSGGMPALVHTYVPGSSTCLCSKTSLGETFNRLAHMLEDETAGFLQRPPAGAVPGDHS